MEPLTSAQLLTAGSQVLSAALKPAPSAPSTAVQTLDQSFDFGNWTVATGKAQAEGGTSGVSLSPWLILAVAVVGALAWKSTRKS